MLNSSSSRPPARAHGPAPVNDATFGASLVTSTPRLRAFVRRLCLGAADDLVQEALTRAWRSRTAFDPAAGSLDAWLMKIAFRTYLDHRARRVPVRLGDGDGAVVALGVAPEVASQVRDDLAQALAPLHEMERDVLMRFHRDGQAVKEIARALDLPEGTVKSHLHRARARLAGPAPEGGER